MTDIHVGLSIRVLSLANDWHWYAEEFGPITRLRPLPLKLAIDDAITAYVAEKIAGAIDIEIIKSINGRYKTWQNLSS